MKGPARHKLRRALHSTQEVAASEGHGVRPYLALYDQGMSYVSCCVMTSSDKILQSTWIRQYSIMTRTHNDSL